MVRLRASGVIAFSPDRSRPELRKIISKLGGGIAPDHNFVDKCYSTLGLIIGEWLQEKTRFEAGRISNVLRSTAKNLDDVSVLFTGREAGLHSDIESTVASVLIEVVRADPTFGLADPFDLISSFAEQAERWSHYCIVAAAGLPSGPGKRGRKSNDWYNSFTRLVLDVLKTLGVKPTLYRNHITNARQGRLLEAAAALETFLPKEMRSPSDESRGKRLERSIKRLKEMGRQ